MPRLLLMLSAKVILIIYPIKNALECILYIRNITEYVAKNESENATNMFRGGAFPSAQLQRKTCENCLSQYSSTRNCESKSAARYSSGREGNDNDDNDVLCCWR